MTTKRPKPPMKPCPNCRMTFRHGERYACCSGCGRAFVGQAAFDAHQTITQDGAVCADPATKVRKDGEPMFEAAATRRKVESGTFWALTPRPGRVNPWSKETSHA